VGRRRIEIGRALRSTGVSALMLASGVWLMAAIACPDARADEPLPAAKLSLVAFEKLAVAQSGNWSTEVFIGNEGASSIAFDTGLCQLFPCVYRTTIAPGGSAAVAVPSGFYTLFAPSSRSYSLLRFNDGLTAQSYAVPPIGFIYTSAATFGPVQSGNGRATTVNVFPDAFTSVRVDVIDGGGNVIASESFEALPPVTQYKVQASFSVGTLRLSLRPCQVAPCATPQPLYGFVAVSDEAGGNAAVLPFR
jgi:hypothetical protein